MFSPILSNEAAAVLVEIIDHETDSDYWSRRFNKLSRREDAILRGCFKELKEKGMIAVVWASNIPYIIDVLKDGYLYEQQLREQTMQKLDSDLSPFERDLTKLLERTNDIKRPINATLGDVDIDEHNRPSQDWINDFEIFYNKYLKTHPLARRIESILFHRTLSAYNDLVSCLTSISNDQGFVESMHYEQKTTSSASPSKALSQYDVFLSHASKDKVAIVEELNSSLERLGITIFYDKKALEWGDKWKERILEGTRKAEFAIIVISENFFDREWTEKELNEFLNRQNANGQKLILPIVHNISNEDLRKKYPQVADIQSIDSKEYTCDQIALLFARQLIKRLKFAN